MRCWGIWSLREFSIGSMANSKTIINFTPDSKILVLGKPDIYSNKEGTSIGVPYVALWKVNELRNP